MKATKGCACGTCEELRATPLLMRLSRGAGVFAVLLLSAMIVSLLVVLLGWAIVAVVDHM